MLEPCSMKRTCSAFRSWWALSMAGGFMECAGVSWNTLLRSTQGSPTRWMLSLCTKYSPSWWLQKDPSANNGSRNQKNPGNSIAEETARTTCSLSLATRWTSSSPCLSSRYSTSSFWKRWSQDQLWNKGRWCSTSSISMSLISIAWLKIERKMLRDKCLNRTRTRWKLMKVETSSQRRRGSTMLQNLEWDYSMRWCSVLLKSRMIWCIVWISTSSSKASFLLWSKAKYRFISHGFTTITSLTISEWLNLEISK